MKYMELIAPCHFGMEAVLKREIWQMQRASHRQTCSSAPQSVSFSRQESSRQ
mgnify:CR=1 FL=1